MSDARSALGSPCSPPVLEATRLHELLAHIRRLAVDQPLLEDRIGELSSLLEDMLAA